MTNMQVFFEQHRILTSTACCLIVALSHNGYVADFCIHQAIKPHKLSFCYPCLMYVYALLNADKCSHTELYVGSVAEREII
jgi:hypothetical protein